MESNSITEKQKPFLKRIQNLQVEVCKLKLEVVKMRNELEILRKTLKNKG